MVSDHHAYAAADLAQVQAQAAALKADLLLTTEKDWVKVVQFPSGTAPAADVWRIDVEFRLLDDGAASLFQQVMNALDAVR